MATNLYFVRLAKLEAPALCVIHSYGAPFDADIAWVEVHLIPADASATERLGYATRALSTREPDLDVMDRIGRTLAEGLVRDAAWKTPQERRIDEVDFLPCTAADLVGPRALEMYPLLAKIASEASDDGLTKFLRGLPATLHLITPGR